MIGFSALIRWLSARVVPTDSTTAIRQAIRIREYRAMTDMLSRRASTNETVPNGYGSGVLKAAQASRNVKPSEFNQSGLAADSLQPNHDIFGTRASKLVRRVIRI